MRTDIQQSFKGLGVALITPFKQDGQIDFTRLAELVNRMIENGVDYLLALGTTSEYPTIAPAEKDDVLRCILETNAKRLPVMVGLGGPNTQFMIRKLEHLALFDVDAILTVTPYYNKPSGFACFNAGHKFGYEKSFLWFENNNSSKNSDIIIDNSAKERQKAFFELHEKYKTTNLLNIDTDSIPFIYPCLVKTEEAANKLAKQIKEEGKTVYRYWNPLPKSFLEYKFYSRLVPIPVLPH